MLQVSSSAGAEPRSCQGCNSCLSTCTEQQPGHSCSEQGGASSAHCPVPGARPCEYHTGQALVMHCSPRWTQRGEDPLADPSESV